jgi:hypothetical protein
MLNLGYVVVGFVVAVVPALVGLIIVAVRGRDRARTIGMIGFGLAALIGLITQTFSVLLPRLVPVTGSSFAVVNTVWGIVVMALHLTEMIILALAIVVNRAAVQPQQPAAAYG